MKPYYISNTIYKLYNVIRGFELGDLGTSKSILAMSSSAGEAGVIWALGVCGFGSASTILSIAFVVDVFNLENVDFKLLIQSEPLSERPRVI